MCKNMKLIFLKNGSFTGKYNEVKGTCEQFMAPHRRINLHSSICATVIQYFKNLDFTAWLDEINYQHSSFEEPPGKITKRDIS